jgi:branched-chain amino acid aminotransferase|tara:strand:+ start:7012 stop:7890 length:879 start_codon:yes stop_codon:yes gene_type:complete
MNLIEFDKLKESIWYNGKFVPCKNAKTHVLDHSIHFASAVFEGIRVYNHKPFKLDEHLVRFYKSAKLLDYKINYSKNDIKYACLQLIKKNKIKNGYIRPLSWRTTGSMAPHAIGVKTSTIIAIWEWPTYYSEDAKSKGIKLTLSNWKRPSNDSAPTQSKCSGVYQICTLAKHDSFRKGFDDALMLDYRNYIAETTSSNIFFVFKDKIITPKPDCFLNGITRQAVIKISKKIGVKVYEKHLGLKDIKKATECFITGTAAEITPVRSIDKLKFNIKKNIITIKLYNNFIKQIQK